jgi:hypothetical protein
MSASQLEGSCCSITLTGEVRPDTRWLLGVSGAAYSLTHPGARQRGTGCSDNLLNKPP